MVSTDDENLPDALREFIRTWGGGPPVGLGIRRRCGCWTVATSPRREGSRRAWPVSTAEDWARWPTARWSCCAALCSGRWSTRSITPGIFWRRPQPSSTPWQTRQTTSTSGDSGPGPGVDGPRSTKPEAVITWHGDLIRSYAIQAASEKVTRLTNETITMLREKREKVAKEDGSIATRNVVARLGKGEMRTDVGLREQVLDVLVSHRHLIPTARKGHYMMMVPHD